MPQIVPPSGERDARLVIVGARPGKDEAREGQPFVGRSGQLLWHLLPLPRLDCYVTNVRRDFSSAHSTPTPSEIKEVLPFLSRELSATTANCIVALGGQALTALTGKHGIEKWRGSILESSILPGRKVIPTIHPAATLRGSQFEGYQSQEQWKYLIRFDLKRAVEQSLFPEIRRPTYDFVINPTLDEAVYHLRRLRGQKLTIDIECPHNRGMRCVGLTNEEGWAMCLPFVGGQLNDWELVTMVKELALCLRDSPVNGQNVKFDIDRLEMIGIKVPNIYFDIMLAHHLLWTELGGSKITTDMGADEYSGGHNLAFITSIYTEEPYYKEEADGWDQVDPPEWRRLWLYNLKDVVVTERAKNILTQELIEFGQLEYYNKRVLRLTRPVLKMEENGMPVDKAALETTRKRMKLELDVLQMRLDKVLAFPCNVYSPADLRVVIEDVCQLDSGKRTKTGKASVDKETLLRLGYHSKFKDLFKLILDIRNRRKMLGSFLHMELGDDSRYRARYLIHGTTMGRLSGRAVAKGKGPQPQNIPKAARKVFSTQRPGVIDPETTRIQVHGDLRRADAMCVAFDAGDEYLMKAFLEGRNTYIEFAQDTLQREVIKEKDPTVYEVFKSSTHATHYGMRGRRFIQTLRVKGIDIEEIRIPGITVGEPTANFIIDRYLQQRKAIPVWQKRITDEVLRTRILHDAFGRRRQFLGPKDDSLIRTALAYRPSATVVGITNEALCEMTDQGWMMIGQVHDSLALECFIKEAAAAFKALEAAMSIPVTLSGRTFTIPVDLSWGFSWGEMYEPDRLAELVPGIHQGS